MIKFDSHYLIAAFLAVVFSFATVVAPSSTSALAGSDFKAGRIADDAVFFSNGSISASEIQNFLNAKMPSCDTNGAKMYDSTQTRAQYGASKGYPAPYTCLRDYTQDIPAKVADQYCSGGVSAGVKSAAQIIFDVSQACNVNAKVLVVLLQKEQSLVTDDWPWSVQYRSATGYGCPDTAPCDAQYYGFYNQVYNAAHQFQRYARNADMFNYKAGQTSFVQYNPNSSCSGTNVALQTQATAALYNYTPYQPNQAALDNLNGTGDACSAYGNRNFWRLYYEYFGTPYSLSLPGCAPATNTTIACIWRLRDASNREVLTSSITERDTLAQNGNIFEGAAFYGNVTNAPQPGNVPVYRLTAPNGETFITTDLNERNGLISSGYTDKGIDFYADRAGSNSGYPVYRLFSSSAGSHVWTASVQERDLLLSNGYSSEGEAFTSIDTVSQEQAAPAGKQLVFRFYIPQSKSHFWTTDLSERDRMISSGYQYEHVAWYSYMSTQGAPVYRLYAPSLTQHLYTTDLSEKNNLVASGGWNYEGISQYVETQANNAPVYRLYYPGLGLHLLTADSNEKTNLLSSGSWKDEGVAWYKP